MISGRNHGRTKYDSKDFFICFNVQGAATGNRLLQKHSIRISIKKAIKWKFYTNFHWFSWIGIFVIMIFSKIYLNKYLLCIRTQNRHHLVQFVMCKKNRSLYRYVVSKWPVCLYIHFLIHSGSYVKYRVPF